MAGILANLNGRIVNPGGGGVKAGTPGVGGCTCCGGCPCPAGVDGLGCNAGTMPASFLATDSGITSPCAAACLTPPGPIPGPWWFDYTIDSGLGATLCLSGGPSIWSGVPVPPVSVTQKRYSDAACAVFVNQETIGMGWGLYRAAGLWRLTLGGTNTDGQQVVAFDGSVTTTDPIDCCQPLSFTNSIAACGTSADAYFAGFAWLIGVGGAVSITPCCPP